jgi:hypothetical protein
MKPGLVRMCLGDWQVLQHKVPHINLHLNCYQIASLELVVKMRETKIMRESRNFSIYEKFPQIRFDQRDKMFLPLKHLRGRDLLLNGFSILSILYLNLFCHKTLRRFSLHYHVLDIISQSFTSFVMPPIFCHSHSLCIRKC